MSEAVIASNVDSVKSRFVLNIDTIACSLVVLLHVMLPLDRGVPTINVGKPLSASIVITLLAFITVWYTSKGELLKGFRRPFASIFTVFVLLVAFESFFAHEPLIAFSRVLRMYCMFVLNYVLLVYTIEKYGYRWLTKAVLFGASYAAILAIGEVTFGRIPVYQFFADASAAAGLDTDSSFGIGIDFFRASGTQGNPIYMSILMGICIPFVFELRSSILRILLIALFLAGSAATVSRTIAVALIVLMVGCGFIYTRKFWLAVSTLVGTLVLVLVLFGSEIHDEPHVMVWEQRVGLRESDGEQADSNIVLRANNSKKIIHEFTENSNPFQILIGHGYYTAGYVALVDSGGPGTLDDTPMTVLYEEGVLGFIIFYGAFCAYGYEGRRYRKVTLHWYNGFALLACGFGTDIETLSMFNIVGLVSIAIVTARCFGKGDSPSGIFRETVTSSEPPLLTEP